MAVDVIDISMFEVGKVIMPLYIENANQYIQLSTGALGFSVVFKEKILGEKGQKNVSIMLAASWALYLFSIGAALLYKYAAVKNLLDVSNYSTGTSFLQSLVGPSELFGLMLLFFFSASALLIFTSGKSLFENNS